MKRSTLAVAAASMAAAVGLGVGVGTGAFSFEAAPTTATSAQLVSAQTDESAVPAQLRVPAGTKLTASLQGVGVQIYQCTDNAWTLLEPAATLTDNDRAVALHFKGPIWVSTVDGSEVGAAAVATVNQPNAIPELLLKANQNQGTGTFGKVTYVQRLQTRGGVAPAGSCTNGAQTSVRYSAQYRFYSAS